MRLTYRWRAMLVIALGLLMTVLDVTIVSVVLPQIATALHSDDQTSPYPGIGYLLANAAVIPIKGGAYAHQEDQGSYTHSNPGRR